MIHQQIMAGKLTMPRINDMEGVYGTEVYKQIELMFTAMWQAYLAKVLILRYHYLIGLNESNIQ